METEIEKKIKETNRILKTLHKMRYVGKILKSLLMYFSSKKRVDIVIGCVRLILASNFFLLYKEKVALTI